MKKLLLLCVLLPVMANAQIGYPATTKGTTVDNYHGTEVPDPYRWLEDDRSDSTKDWVTRQNKVTFDYLGRIQYRKQWQDRLEDINNYAKYSSPFRQGADFYFYKNDGLQNQSVLYRQKGLNGKPELLLDPNQFSAEGTTALAAFSISKNGKYAVVGKSAGGSDWRTFFVMDLSTKKYLKDSLAWVKVSGVSWQGNGFFYSRYPAPEKGMELSVKNENHQVYYHTVGTTQDKDQLIYEDKANPQQFNSVFTDETESYVFLTSNDRGKGKEGNSLWYYDSKSTDKKFKPIIKDIGNYQYSFVAEVNGKFILQTNDDARNRRIILVDPLHPEKENWTSIIPEAEENMSGVTSAGNKLFVTYMKDVTSRVYVYDLNGKLEREVKLPGLGTAGGFGGKREDAFVFYTFTSITYPPTIFKYDIATGASSLFRQPEVKFDPQDYVTDQIFYPSKDGTQIPMFIVHKKGLEMNGKNPAILYGYGGFNISSTPNFSPTRIAWLEQGGVYCIANLRGGSEYGEKWHEAGMREKKQNVFDDFIAAAEFLIGKGYTSPDYLAAQGGSNGGLLVGAVINQRPDLFKVAIPQVGVMDMLRYHKFTIGWNWIPEYGSSEKPGDFKNLFAYSPIHNIKSGINYPATLVTTADHDDRVVPAHSFKYAATLQEYYKGNNPMLIRIDVNSGHGASNLKKALETTADIYSFIFYNMGLTPEFKLTADGKKHSDQPDNWTDMKVLITGANGFLGHYLVPALLQQGFDVLATGKGACRLTVQETNGFGYAEMDFTDLSSTLDTVSRYAPDIIVHAGAVSKPDDCELNQPLAWQINTGGTHHLLEAAAVQKAFFLYVSTDFVFDGERGMYTEEDEPAPVNYYGRTKLEAEQAVQEYPYPWAVVRTVLVYGQPLAGRSNILSIVKDKLEKGEGYKVVDDQVRTPTYVGDLADGIVSIIQKKATGTWHLSGEDVLTPYEMACKTADFLGFDRGLLTRVTADTFTQPAKRPAKTGFNIAKAKRELDYKPVSFEKGLALTFA